MSTDESVFDKSGNWYKGNVHTHSNVFDGLKPPEEVISLYRDNGYNFLVLTDHNIYNTYPEFNTDSFIMLNGTELTYGLDIDYDKFREELANNTNSSDITQEEMIQNLISSFNSPDMDIRRLPHVLAIGRDENQKWDNINSAGFDDIQYMLDLANEHNCISIIAHPVWSKLNSNDLHGLKGYTAIEVYNHTCEDYFAGGDSSFHWDDMLHENMPTNAIACDDMHDPKVSLGGYIMVKADKLDYSSIVKAIDNGDYYSTTGPKIKDIKIENGLVTVKCSKAKSVRFITDIVYGRTYIDESCNTEECSHQLAGPEKYVRIEVTDENNKKAWSNPFYL